MFLTMQRNTQYGGRIRFANLVNVEPPFLKDIIDKLTVMNDAACDALAKLLFCNLIKVS